MVGPAAHAGLAVVVAGFGAVAVDQLVYVDQPYAAGKGRIIGRHTSYGGNAGTALAVAAALGGQARFIGYLPDKAMWPEVYADLAGYNIDVSSATAPPGTPPIRATILITPDDERFVAFDDDTLVGAPLDLDLELVTSAGVLLLDGYNPISGLRAVRAARAAGVPVVGDLERIDAEGLDELQREIDHLVVPLAFAAAYTGTDSPDAAIRWLWNGHRSAVVVTDGRHGSWYKDGNAAAVKHIPAFPVEVVDTNGCGDVFHGAYAVSIAQGHPIDQALARASAAAAICATARGGRGRIPTEQDVRQLLASKPKSPIAI